MVKKCSKCGVEKELTEFPRDKSRKDGYGYWCRLCSKNNRTKERVKQYNNTFMSTVKGRKQRQQNVKKWRLKNKDKIREQGKRYQKTYYSKYPEKANLLPNRKYVTWILKPIVLERDNNTCQYCLATGIPLNCHHIIPVKYAPETVKDINNLITLCKDCHKKVHDNNTKTYDPVWAELALERNLQLKQYFINN
jgi:5-methylcytosine-specific restriction endonuclease McrA